MSLKTNLYSYINILIIGAAVFLITLLADMVLNLPVSTLTIVFLLLLLYVCVNNGVLMSKEGFRPIPSLIYVITAMYIMDSYFLWFGTEILPAAILPFYRVIRPFIRYMECTVIAIWIMGYAVLKIKPVYDKDYVIILGCSISKNGLLRPLIKKRVNRAIHFVWEQEIENEKTAYYVPSGGKGDDEPLSEGSAMELYLLSHGAEDFEVFPEKKSRNTEENLKFSKKIINDLKPDAKIAVVTSDFHVLRSGMLAKKEGMEVQVIGSESKWYFWPGAFFRETIAILYMYRKVHIVALLICFAFGIKLYI